MTTTSKGRVIAPLVAIGLASSLVACGTTSINRIMAEPSRYANKDASLSGDVTDSVSLLGHGAFQLDDGTGTLWVVSRSGVPRRGARVKVRGKVRDVVDAGRIVKLPNEVGSGLVMIADDVRAK